MNRAIPRDLAMPFTETTIPVTKISHQQISLVQDKAAAVPAVQLRLCSLFCSCPFYWHS